MTVDLVVNLTTLVTVTTTLCWLVSRFTRVEEHLAQLKERLDKHDLEDKEQVKEIESKIDDVRRSLQDLGERIQALAIRQALLEQILDVGWKKRDGTP